MLVSDYLRPAAVKARVLPIAEDGTVYDTSGSRVRRFGFHNLRHSLSTALITGESRPAHGAGHDASQQQQHDAGPVHAVNDGTASDGSGETAGPDSAAERVGQLNGTDNGTGFFSGPS